MHCGLEWRLAHIQLLDWLMQAVESGRQDLPDTFWQWLLLEQIGEDDSP